VRQADLDTLLIKKGTYREFNIQIGRPEIFGGPQNPVIDGEIKGRL